MRQGPGLRYTPVTTRVYYKCSVCTAPPDRADDKCHSHHPRKDDSVPGPKPHIAALIAQGDYPVSDICTNCFFLEYRPWP